MGFNSVFKGLITLVGGVRISICILQFVTWSMNGVGSQSNIIYLSDIQRQKHLQHGNLIKIFYCTRRGHAVAQFVEALRYKPEGRGFDSRWCHWDFSLT